MYPKTIASVNKELRKQGFTVKAVAGDGYYYFLDPEGNQVGDSVMVYRASEYSMENWLKEAKDAQEAGDADAKRRAAMPDGPFVLKLGKRPLGGLSGLGTFAGLLGGADAFDGQIARVANKWVFISGVFAGKQFRWTFDASADNTPEVGPAVLYGAIGSNSLAAVFQHGRAVGWFRGDQRAYVSPKMASRSKS